MKNLIIYAHPTVPSFSEQVVEKVIETAKAKGDEVIFRDLYKLEFNPVLTGNDMAALQEGNIPEDIKIEQDFIKEADVLTFIFPIWWADMPAIMKGYIDKVFSYGFAYLYDENGPKPLLTDKKVIIISSAGGTKEVYENSGAFESQKNTIDYNKFGFCGFEILEHKRFYGNPMTTPEKIPAYLDEVEELIKKF